MEKEVSLADPAKLLLLISLLYKDKIINYRGKAILKELIIKNDPRISHILGYFDPKTTEDASFLMDINNLIDVETQRWFQFLYEDCPLDKGKILSKSEREALGLLDEKSLIYGEVEHESFAEILSRIKLQTGGIFYDLGSGTGRAVFLARLTHEFDKCIGIELLQGLFEASEMVLERYQTKVFPVLTNRSHQDVFFHRGSFLDYDWSDADVCFANSTCFDEDLMHQLGQHAERMKQGSYFITFTKPLPSKHFQILEKKRYEMSWGPATVFIQCKTTRPVSTSL